MSNKIINMYMWIIYRVNIFEVNNTAMTTSRADNIDPTPCGVGGWGISLCFRVCDF